MTTVHAWFSAATAIGLGSSVYRKPSGATVNVTRTNADRDAKGHHPYDEKYVGEVICFDDGGCVKARSRVKGISE